MKLQIEYVHDGKTGIVTTIPADIIKWEKTTNQKFSNLWDKDQLNIGIYDLAVFIWAVLTRKIETAEPFETWHLRLDEITDFGEPDSPKATALEASSDSGSSTQHSE